MIRRWRRHRHFDVAEMNITAFMNLMVVLVPFLLITAVFSRMAVLQLALPGGDEAAAPAADVQQLTVTLRGDRLELLSPGAEAQVIANTASGYDLARLSRALQAIKARDPQRRAATILLEPDIPYEKLVQVMDSVRAARVLHGLTPVPVELFPDIAIGDAPAAAAGAAPP